MLPYARLSSGACVHMSIAPPTPATTGSLGLHNDGLTWGEPSIVEAPAGQGGLDLSMGPQQLRCVQVILKRTRPDRDRVG